MHTTIKTLFNKGYNKTQIANILHVDRKTVRKVLKELSTCGKVERKERATLIDEHKEYIQIQVNKGLTARRIYQDLIREYDYKNSYDTVKRYVAKLKISKPKAYMVLTSLPGEEAQVDFGYIGTLPTEHEKRRKAWIFIMTLSYSRYMYVEIVFDQSVATFINCHKNAFRYFGGIPKNVIIDNLKAAVLENDFYEPTMQRNYAAFAAHYGCTIEPCRVRTPTDKGKVEANVKYVKDNCFKGRDFKSVDYAKEFLRTWLEEIGNKRIHGTTHMVPTEVFLSTEKDKLINFPDEDYIISDISKAIVMTNCHISYKANNYSVPYTYIGEQVDIIVKNNILKVYKSDKEIALHPVLKNEKGKFITDKSHYPKSKNITIQDIKSTYRKEMAQIGENALNFFDEFDKLQHNKYEYRAISGILSLRKNYSNAIIDNACLRAVTYNALKYKFVKNICQKGLENFSVQKSIAYVNEEETSISRPLSTYSKKYLN